MRALLVLFVLSAPLLAAICKGEDPCPACKDCSRCAYCNSGKGSCGTVRTQNTEAEKKRQAAKAKAGKKR